MLHPASQQNPFMVDLHEQVGRTPNPALRLAALASGKSGQGAEEQYPDFTLLNSLLRSGRHL